MSAALSTVFLTSSRSSLTIIDFFSFLFFADRRRGVDATRKPTKRARSIPPLGRFFLAGSQTCTRFPLLFSTRAPPFLILPTLDERLFFFLSLSHTASMTAFPSHMLSGRKRKVDRNCRRRRNPTKSCVPRTTTRAQDETVHSLNSLQPNTHTLISSYSSTLLARWERTSQSSAQSSS